MSTEENAKATDTQQSDQNRKPRRRRRSRRPRNDAPRRWTPAQFQVPVVEGKKRFHDFNLPDVLMHAIADQGFEYCTPIQAETIEPALAGKDIIGKAQTGTGKTAAFLVGIITDLLDFPLEGERKLAEPRALIIAPTRELAMQIASDAENLSRFARLNVVTLVGGMDYDRQRKELARGPVDILVATPGRLIDFVRGKEVDLFHVEVLVLDEADRMLSMGFIPDVRTIIRQTPRKGPERQTLLYSATFTEDILRLAEQWTVDPVRIEIESEHKTTDNVAQKVFLVSSNEKYNLLRNYLRVNNIDRAIVFCNRRHETRSLAERLRKDGMRAALMSGEIPQNKRVKTLEDFRSGKIQVLVATDVAGRGIHIDGVTHVINYQLPDDPDDYVHRIGRTGRAGATGTSICFACENDSFMIPQVEEETGVKLECIHPDAELLVEPGAVSDSSAKDSPDAVESGDKDSELQDSEVDNADSTESVTDAPAENVAAQSGEESPVSEAPAKQVNVESADQTDTESATGESAEASAPEAGAEPVAEPVDSQATAETSDEAAVEQRDEEQADKAVLDDQQPVESESGHAPKERIAQSQDAPSGRSE